MKSKQFPKYITILLLGLLCVTLSGCVNLSPTKTEMKLYALGPVEVSMADDAQGRDLRDLHIARPNLPVYLDGKRLQYRGIRGEIGELSGARWAEHLEEGVARSLAEYLIEEGATSATSFYPWPQRSRVGLTLRVYFNKLGAMKDGSIRMVASWDLQKGSVQQRSGVFESSDIKWEPGSADSLVAGLNTALREFADAIATGL